jgi:hypothetical protein
VRSLSRASRSLPFFSWSAKTTSFAPRSDEVAPEFEIDDRAAAERQCVQQLDPDGPPRGLRRGASDPTLHTARAFKLAHHDLRKGDEHRELSHVVERRQLLEIALGNPSAQIVTPDEVIFQASQRVALGRREDEGAACGDRVKVAQAPGVVDFPSVGAEATLQRVRQQRRAPRGEHVRDAAQPSDLRFPR